MKTTLWTIAALAAVMTVTSCKHLDEEPEINLGYASNYVVPDPEPLTPEDEAAVAAEKAEYAENAK